MTETVTLDPALISALVGMAVPLVVAFLTSAAETSTGLRKTLALALSAAVGVIVVAIQGGPFELVPVLVSAGTAFVSNVVAYVGIHKGSGVITAAYEVGPSLGAPKTLAAK